MLEQWRPVKNFEGAYAISNLRRVRSLPRFIGHWRGGLRLWSGRIMKVHTKFCTAGAINLRKYGTVRRIMVNAMMREAWPEIKTAPKRRSNRSRV